MKFQCYPYDSHADVGCVSPPPRTQPYTCLQLSSECRNEKLLQIAGCSERFSGAESLRMTCCIVYVKLLRRAISLVFFLFKRNMSHRYLVLKNRPQMLCFTLRFFVQH